jgi:hypothetical protein
LDAARPDWTQARRELTELGPALAVRTDDRFTYYSVDDGFSYVDGPPSERAWRDQRRHWATLWRELSRYEPTSGAYQSLLLQIVQLFAVGSNHVALRTGEQVTNAVTSQLTDEFEYREFYLNDQWVLSPRKVRLEPIRCADGSTTLDGRIAADWNAPAGAMRFWRMLGPRLLEPDEQATLTAHCGGELPYDQELDSGGYGHRAKLVRFRHRPASTWRVPALDEAQRRAFASETCSGCHATETDNPAGFHIAPRLAGVDSRVSRYLAGGALTVTPIPGGPSYTTNEREERRVLVKSFFEGEHHTEQRLLCDKSPCVDTTYDGIKLSYPPEPL